MDFDDEGACFSEVDGLIEDDGGIEILDDGGGVSLFLVDELSNELGDRAFFGGSGASPCPPSPRLYDSGVGADSDDGDICFSDVGGLIKGGSGIDISYDGDGVSSCPSGELLSG